MKYKLIISFLSVFALIFVLLAKDSPSIPIAENTDIPIPLLSPIDPEAQAMMDSIYANYEQFKSLKVNMVLTTGYLNNIEKDTIYGFMEGKKYRLEMPHQNVVHDGRKVWFYDKITKKAFSKDYKPSEANFIYPIKTIQDWENAFDCSITGELNLGKHTFIKVSFTQKESRLPHSAPQIDLYVDKDNFQILKITLLQPNGYIHMLDYFDMQPNIKLDPSTFVLNIS